MRGGGTGAGEGITLGRVGARVRVFGFGLG